jgi:hypothetical protein
MKQRKEFIHPGSAQPAGLPSTGPLTKVMGAMAAGARSPMEIAQVTGFDQRFVETMVNRLVTTGRITSEPLLSGCPTGSCGGCAIASSCSSAPPPAAERSARGRVLSVVGASSERQRSVAVGI